MKTPKKAVVTKKPTNEVILSAKRWTAFCEASKTEWEELSEEFKDFFYTAGKAHGLTTEELNEAIDKAVESGK